MNMSSQVRYRSYCWDCRQPQLTCFCAKLIAFDPKITFVILVHPLETKHRLVTGRMSYLSLVGAEWIRGEDFSQEPRVNELLDDVDNHNMLLSPGKDALDLSQMNATQRRSLCNPHKRLVVFVIDGTWATARKMLRLSRNLSNLPKICFTPTTPSRFRVRKQPRPHCTSTVEAIHHTIELLGDGRGFDVASRRHDTLLQLFDAFVEQQIELAKQAKLQPLHKARRRLRLPVSL